jgi:hypothetical protein
MFMKLVDTSTAPAGQSPRTRWVGRTAAVTAAVVATALLATTSAEAATLTTIAAGKNPFDGVVPDFDVFGAQFNAAWKKLLGGIWAMGFAITGFSAVRAAVNLAKAKRGGYSAQVAEQTEDAKWAGAAFVALSMLGVLVGGLVAMF